MIIGLGIDVIEVARMQRTIERYGEKFLDHVFSSDEQEDAPKGAGKPSYYAGRWAAKEAVAKALGTGIGKDCGWTDVRVRRDELGKPRIELTGAAAKTSERLEAENIHISISHERHLACASAVIEAAPRSPSPLP
ncbi:MAG: holo-ACP synthase [Lentisphaerae bacterium]|jgi:holo-[acyl-carrier protein] synthase|nr:holo-ACP synthase [Lentisphaerota bacterium]MBT4819902.1 holo-ACP synthase [Lentisphaerota bacterium]MBT5608177.1 holo-ACP synthase [Lentisphaerota bacterium]MBT7058934.1 holo-ACP synthase [Lentisphaerota bacterium]MBT7842835.1 holo-ACP synthase [Lentisphaerota bacterium]